MKTYKELKRMKSHCVGLPKVRIAVVGDTSTQLLCTAIRGMGVERGLDIDFFEADYNQVELQLLDSTSDLFRHDADFIVIFQSTHKLGIHHAMLDTEDQAALAEERIDFLTSVCERTALTGKKITYHLSGVFKKTSTPKQVNLIIGTSHF